MASFQSVSLERASGVDFLCELVEFSFPVNVPLIDNLPEAKVAELFNILSVIGSLSNLVEQAIRDLRSKPKT